MARAQLLWALRLLVACHGCSSVLGTAARTAARAYWSSSPTLAAETLTIAGAFPTNITSVQLCTDANQGSCQPAADVETWSHSVKARLPEKMTRPLWLEVGTGDTPPSSNELRVAVNAPDIWFTLGLVNGLPVDQSTPLPTGAILRTFGRALAWAGPSGMQCIDARSRSSAHTVDSSLVLTPLVAPAVSSLVRVAARNASCYEAAFPLADTPPGRYSAVVQTGWGVSRAWVLEIQTSTGRRSSSQKPLIQVDDSFRGDVQAALAYAATLPSGGVVELGPRTYTLNSSLALPNNTVLRGASTAATRLVFDFHSKGAASTLLSSII